MAKYKPTPSIMAQVQRQITAVDSDDMLAKGAKIKAQRKVAFDRLHDLSIYQMSRGFRGNHSADERVSQKMKDVADMLAKVMKR